MRYKNKKTGAVIDTFGEIAGADWEKVSPVLNESEEEQILEVQDAEEETNDSVPEKPPVAKEPSAKKKAKK